MTWPAAASFRTPVAGSASPPANSTPPGSEPAVLEELVLDQINAVRALHGLPSLAAATELTAAARRHSADMAAHAFLDHTGSDGSSFTQRITEAGYGWSRAGEIVAKGYPDAAAVVLGWMNSPDHRAIIMTPDYRDVGAGVARGADGALYWTVDFGARR
ncbi:MAG: CAP domain-containing protein [Chloroflexi bacterium]|nr:CAP domain-containing protein [Chloroflexota bacterium]